MLFATHYTSVVRLTDRNLGIELFGPFSKINGFSPCDVIYDALH
jgi:hypothetical protein